MQSKAETVEHYIEELPSDRKAAIIKLRKVILHNLPKGFEEVMSYGMIGYVVPLTMYPAGYHVNKKLPLPFFSIISQKNFIAFYHMGLYVHKPLLKWFTEQYAVQCNTKLDMGKGCVRFKKPIEIPFDLIGKLAGKLKPTEWISVYESNLKR
jgi:hypothetical protein